MLVRFLIIALLPALALAEPTLRYQLKPGQELVYHSRYRNYPTSNPSQTGYEDTSIATVRIILRNPDGSWQAIQQHQDCKPDFTPSRETPTVAEFTLTPLGKVTSKASPNEMQPGGSFIELPADESTVEWTLREEADNATKHYRKLPATEPSVQRFESERNDGFFDRLYGWSFHTQYRFDRNAGLVTRIDNQTDDSRRNERGEGTFELVSNQQCDSAWMNQYATEARAVASAQSAYRDAWKTIVANDQINQAAADAAVAALRTAADSIKLPELSQILPDRIKAHTGQLKEAKEEQEAVAGILHHPAAGWKLVDLEGKTHTLAEQHGKVVVLDFWYRGCGWCMKAMPAMKTLAEDYKDKPVIFFGMNVDSDEADARFVVDFFKLPYATLRTKFAPYGKFDSPATVPSDLNIPAASYMVQGYPTVIVIDANGVLQLRDVGYSPDLHDSLKKKIDELLAQRALNQHGPA